MSDFTFAATEIPSSRSSAGRRPEPNPFIDAVADLVDRDGKPIDEALSFVVDSHTWETPQVQKLARQLSKAGKAHGVSVYKRFDATPDGQGTVITFWTQTRHKGGRKPAQPVDA